MLIIILFGPPGAGKGTQSQILIEKYNLLHLATGDILRNAIERKTPRGIEAKKYMDRGELVPDDLVIGIIGRQLDENLVDKNGVVLDGFPRTTVQAEALEAMLAERGMSITLMMALEVEHNELIKRLINRGLTSGRPDDQTETIIKNRINIYNETTRNVIDFYKKQGKYCGILGMGTIEEIFERISVAIEQRLTQPQK
jgi:adenylate kinase